MQSFLFTRSCTQSCVVLFLLFEGTCAQAQIKAVDAESFVRFGETQVTRYQIRLSVSANRGAVRDVFATMAVPIACPEQEVELLEEDISDYVRSHDYRFLQGGEARQMLVRMPRLPNKAEAHVFLTFEVRTRVILPPEETSEFVIPTKLPRELKRYLGKSPYIETRHSKFKKLAKKIFTTLEHPREDASDPTSGELASAGGAPPKDSPPQLPPPQHPPQKKITDWQRVEALYTYIQDTIQYKEQDDKSALATLKDGHGDCQNISALFVALCRTQKIPARIVWVHQHNYPEFCLADAEGKLHWFPCESSGTRAFGEMPLARVIMQKGDNFKVPEHKKARHSTSFFLTGRPAAPGGGPPSYKFNSETL